MNILACYQLDVDKVSLRLTDPFCSKFGTRTPIRKKNSSSIITDEALNEKRKFSHELISFKSSTQYFNFLRHCWFQFLFQIFGDNFVLTNFRKTLFFDVVWLQFIPLFHSEEWKVFHSQPHNFRVWFELELIIIRAVLFSFWLSLFLSASWHCSSVQCSAAYWKPQIYVYKVEKGGIEYYWRDWALTSPYMKITNKILKDDWHWELIEMSSFFFIEDKLFFFTLYDRKMISCDRLAL